MKLIPTTLAPATAFLLAASSALAGTWNGIERVPGHEPVTVMVEGKPRVYFRATPQAPVVVSVRGPARLRVVSRVEMPPGANQPFAYHVRVGTPRRLLEENQTQAPPSRDAALRRSDHPVGESRQIIVKVPKGDQELRVSVEGASSVLIRLLTAAPARGRQRTVSLTPVEAARSISLKEDEKLVPYYSALPGKPVRFRVIGPTTLDLITRLDFDPTMRGTQSYRIAISDGGKRVRDVEFKTTKALTATYPEVHDRVPSKFRRVQMPVGAGVHEISLDLVRPKGGSVEVHARIPELSVGDTE